MATTICYAVRMVIKKTDGSTPLSAPPIDAKAAKAPTRQTAPEPSQVRDELTRTATSHSDSSAVVAPPVGQTQQLGVVASLLDHPLFGEPNPHVAPASGPSLALAPPSVAALQHEVGPELTALLHSLPPESTQAEALRRLEHELGGFQFLAATHYR